MKEDNTINILQEILKSKIPDWDPHGSTIMEIDGFKYNNTFQDTWNTDDDNDGGLLAAMSDCKIVDEEGPQIETSSKNNLPVPNHLPAQVDVDNMQENDMRTDILEQIIDSGILDWNPQESWTAQDTMYDGVPQIVNSVEEQSEVRKGGTADGQEDVRQRNKPHRTHRWPLKKAITWRKKHKTQTVINHDNSVRSIIRAIRYIWMRWSSGKIHQVNNIWEIQTGISSLHKLLVGDPKLSIEASKMNHMQKVISSVVPVYKEEDDDDDNNKDDLSPSETSNKKALTDHKYEPTPSPQPALKSPSIEGQQTILIEPTEDEIASIVNKMVDEELEVFRRNHFLPQRGTCPMSSLTISDAQCISWVAIFLNQPWMLMEWIYITGMVGVGHNTGGELHYFMAGVNYLPLPFSFINISSAENANKALNLAAEKILQLVKWLQKMPEDTLALKKMVHEITITLATTFAQHGNATTLLVPILLSCTAKIQDKSAPNGRLRTLPDWSVISDDDQQIQGHPLYGKTLGYRHQDSHNALLAGPAIPHPVLYVSLPPPLTVVAPTPVPSPHQAQPLCVQKYEEMKGHIICIGARIGGRGCSTPTGIAETGTYK
ncbi:uncharacterized protein F5147DRAFT_652941 [Suillus discolor]|uniref:Uncharacterized protein n=1 Tax=Suillus discolor TaxID=1912936 RepID=A0A9P7JU28_9AGAM|nr:uncharacterized protein F5147DRAFT_652941 [Suillus discolor]KAG2108217.1 hypothetical protein F5147DRAFT_652941 [Suillus discolor]